MKPFRSLAAIASIASLMSCTAVDTTGPQVSSNYKIDTARVDYAVANRVVFYDFSTGTAVERKASDWDLAINLTDHLSFGMIISNSGDYGFGTRIYATGDTTFTADFSAMAANTETPFAISTEKAPIPGVEWYIYDNPTHKATATKQVYLIKTADGTFKVQFIAPTPKALMLKIAPVAAGDAPMTSIAKAEGTQLTYIDLGTKAAVDFAPADSLWDVKFCRTEENQAVPGMTYIAGRSSIILNSYGGVESAMVPGASITTVRDIAGLTFSNHFQAINYSWYAVDLKDVQNPIYSVPANTFVLKDTDGAFIKFEMNSLFGPAGQKYYSPFVYLMGSATGTFAE